MTRSIIHKLALCAGALTLAAALTVQPAFADDENGGGP